MNRTQRFMEHNEDGRNNISLGDANYMPKSIGIKENVGFTCGMKPKDKKGSSHRQHRLSVRIDNIVPNPATKRASWEHFGLQTRKHSDVEDRNDASGAT